MDWFTLGVIVVLLGGVWWRFHRRRPPTIRVLGIGRDVLHPLPDVTRNYRRTVADTGVYEEQNEC